MRELTAVIRQILEVVPATSPDLRAELRKNQQSALCTPPECMHERWQQVGYTLGYYLGLPALFTEPWQQKAFELFRGDVAAVEKKDATTSDQEVTSEAR